MINTIIIESFKGRHKPSRWACESLTSDVQENAATSIKVMLDGTLRAQSMRWGTKTISVTGSGRVAPHLDDVPMGELLTLHSASQTSCLFPLDMSLNHHVDLEDAVCAQGYEFISFSISEFETFFPCRTESMYEPIVTSMYTRYANPDNLSDVGDLEIFEGRSYRRGDQVYCEIFSAFEELRVSYFPKYKGFLVQPVSVTTDNNTGVVSWSFELISSTDRMLDEVP